MEDGANDGFCVLFWKDKTFSEVPMSNVKGGPPFAVGQNRSALWTNGCQVIEMDSTIEAIVGPISAEVLHFLKSLVDYYEGKVQNANEQVLTPEVPHAQVGEQSRPSSHVKQDMRELVEGSGVLVSSMSLRSVLHEAGTNPVKLFLLLLENIFGKEKLGVCTAYRKGKGDETASYLDRNKLDAIFAFTYNFGKINKREREVEKSKLKRILTQKLQTEKASKERSLKGIK